MNFLGYFFDKLVEKLPKLLFMQMYQVEPKWKSCPLILTILIYLDAASPTGQMHLSFQILVF